MQIDIDSQNNDINNIIEGMKIMSMIGQYSKSPFHKFILIEHYPEPRSQLDLKAMQIVQLISSLKIKSQRVGG